MLFSFEFCSSLFSLFSTRRHAWVKKIPILHCCVLSPFLCHHPRVISTLDEGSSVSSPPGFDMLRRDMLMILVFNGEKCEAYFLFFVIIIDGS